MKKRALMLFAWDLRLQDAPALQAAARQADQLICAALPIDQHPAVRAYESQVGDVSPARRQFIQQCRASLALDLLKRGHSLYQLSAQALEELSRLIEQQQITLVYRHRHPGHYENALWSALRERFAGVQFLEFEARTLFHQASLPFSLADIPRSFTAFRKQVESRPIEPARPAPQHLPLPPAALDLARVHPQAFARLPGGSVSFIGGEAAGLAHMQAYFAAGHASRYKQTRNALSGWSQSSKLSAWLASGSLSPRQVYQALRAYESLHGANESTYWLYFELLWREYFQWLASVLGPALFRFRGLKATPPLTSFYPQRFQAWCAGRTPWPIVNACMRELKATGYMSNRGRQLVASCLVNELQLDWRYGAAYFERQLLDYDMASNWGNWQYLAGVGVDPRGGRHFDLDKQTRLYDPQGRFIRSWAGEVEAAQLDVTDMVDWPVAAD